MTGLPKKKMTKKMLNFLVGSYIEDNIDKIVAEYMSEVIEALDSMGFHCTDLGWNDDINRDNVPSMWDQHAP